MTKTKKFKAPLVGRITKREHMWWTGYVPAIGAFIQATSVLDAASTLKRVIEMMFRYDGERVSVTVTVTVPEPAVKGVANVSVMCDRPGLLEARAAEFARLSAGVKGPIRNPFFVAVRRRGITVAHNVEPKWLAKPTNMQRIEHMRERVALVTETAGRARRMPTAPGMRDATIYRLSIIGVAAAATTKAFRTKHASVPWTDAIAMRKFLGKPDRLLDHAALRKAVRETVPALAKTLARPEFEMDHVERLKIARAETKALREWAAKNPVPKPKKRKRGTRPAPTPQAARDRTAPLSAVT